MARTFYEFFAGGGMARAGLGKGWECVFANDFDPKKAQTYAANWGGRELTCEDVASLSARNLPGTADLVWASFPCQDLSLAGDYRGLGHHRTTINRTRSGTFWPFWSIIRDMTRRRRAPKVIVLENVYGAITSNGGRDFAAIASALSGSGYRFGAIVVDAVNFVPQSRKRVFFIAVRRDVRIPRTLISRDPIQKWHPLALLKAQFGLSGEARSKWIWWNLPAPPKMTKTFADVIETNPTSVKWDSQEETRRILGMMTEVNLEKVASAKKMNKLVVGGVYKRTRSAHGLKIQRAEVRFDDIAGCLRTPGGGSSRQRIMVVEGNSIRTRLLSSREAARLMGLPEKYKLPKKYNDAYHVAGDGVVVPVVRHLAKHILEPIIDARPFALQAAE